MANLDLQAFKDAQDQGKQLQSVYGARAALFQNMEQIFFMDWSEQGKVKKQYENVKLTLSPDGRNTLLGAARLMIATDPQFSVPTDKNDPESKEKSEPIEKFINRMWMAAGKVAGTPIHYDATLSALLYSDVNIAVTSVQDLLTYASAKGGATKSRVEAVAARTPYLFNVWNPADCYPRFDRLGLTGHYRRTIQTSAEILSTYGTQAAFLEEVPKTKQYTLCEWWDLEFHVIWLEGNDTPIVSVAHKLPFIPIVSAVTEGSVALWAKPEMQRQPFLYTLYKSNLWNRQNLALTILYTMIAGIGANPMFLYKTNQAGKKLDVDFSRMGGLVTIDTDETYEPLVKVVIDPSILTGLSTADQKVVESTIYKQALGEPLSGNAAYSMVALLNQAGRLPLISTKQRLGWAISQAVEIACKWLKLEGKQQAAFSGGQKAELKPADIPDTLEVETQLEIDLPQDQLTLANIANMISSGDDPLVSKQWARENVLHIGQSDEMTTQVWREKAAAMFATQFWMQQMAIIQQQMQAQQAPAQQAPVNVTSGAAPGGQLPTTPTPQGLPPEMAQAGQAMPQQVPSQQIPPELAGGTNVAQRP